VEHHQGMRGVETDEQVRTTNASTMQLHCCCITCLCATQGVSGCVCEEEEEEEEEEQEEIHAHPSVICDHGIICAQNHMLPQT